MTQTVIPAANHDLAVNLRWNEFLTMIGLLLRYCELRDYRPPSSDCYTMTRIAREMGRFFDSADSVGIGPYAADGYANPNGKVADGSIGGRDNTRPQVPVKDFYGISDVAALLQISVNTVRALARAEGDPMPFRRLKALSRGMFITRGELVRWALDNSDLVAELRRREPPDEG